MVITRAAIGWSRDTLTKEDFTFHTANEFTRLIVFMTAKYDVKKIESGWENFDVRLYIGYCRQSCFPATPKLKRLSCRLWCPRWVRSLAFHTFWRTLEKYAVQNNESRERSIWQKIAIHECSNRLDVIEIKSWDRYS